MGTPRYGFERRLADTNFAQAVEKVTTALKDEGFGVLTEIDVKATLRKKLDVDFRRYVMLGACNPSLAPRALAPEAGVVVSIADPRVMFTMVDNPAVEPAAAEADAQLRRVIDAVGGKEAV